jgi:hypothetical protein
MRVAEQEMEMELSRGDGGIIPILGMRVGRVHAADTGDERFVRQI